MRQFGAIDGDTAGHGDVRAAGIATGLGVDLAGRKSRTGTSEASFGGNSVSPPSGLDRVLDAVAAE